MVDAFSKLNGGEILGLCGLVLGLIAVVGGLALGLAALVAVYRRRVQLDDMEATLKMEMIQRGMSGDEIAQVLKARTGADRNVNLNFNGLQGLKKPLEFAKQHEKA